MLPFRFGAAHLSDETHYTLAMPICQALFSIFSEKSLHMQIPGFPTIFTAKSKIFQQFPHVLRGEAVYGIAELAFHREGLPLGADLHLSLPRAV